MKINGFLLKVNEILLKIDGIPSKINEKLYTFIRLFIRLSRTTVGEKIPHSKFPGRGQRKTPVTDVRGAVELAFLLPGRHA